MCVTVTYLQRVLSKIVSAHCKKAVYTLHRLQVHPQHVIHIVCLQDAHLCNIDKVMKQEREKALHCGLLAPKFWFFLICMFSSVLNSCL